MAYEEFKRLLGKAGISIKELAALLKQNPNSYTNYKSDGYIPRHLAVIVTLMAEMADHHLEFKPAVKNLHLTPRKPRGTKKPMSSSRFGK